METEHQCEGSEMLGEESLFTIGTPVRSYRFDSCYSQPIVGSTMQHNITSYSETIDLILNDAVMNILHTVPEPTTRFIQEVKKFLVSGNLQSMLNYRALCDAERLQGYTPENDIFLHLTPIKKKYQFCTHHRII